MHVSGKSKGAAVNAGESDNSFGSSAAKVEQSFRLPVPFQKLDRKTLEKVGYSTAWNHSSLKDTSAPTFVCVHLFVQMSSDERYQALGQQCRTSRLAMACRCW